MRKLLPLLLLVGCTSSTPVVRGDLSDPRYSLVRYLGDIGHGVTCKKEVPNDDRD
jgi:hypothetical protein